TVQAGNTGTQGEDELGAIQDEIEALIQEIGGTGESQGISDRTQFNGKDLLTGDFADGGDKGDIVFQIGANQEQQLSVNINDMSAVGLALYTEASGEGGETTPAAYAINVQEFVDGDGKVKE